MQTPTISVIVPVYNASRWLDACIGSLLRQTFSDFELLLIDDGSKDDSLQICQRYAQSDERIRVIHKKNGGVSSTRNMGLDNARGRWAVFVDSDDSVTADYLQGLYQARTATPEGARLLVMAGFQSVNEHTGEPITSNIFPEQVYRGREIVNGLIEYHLTRYGHPYSKLYDREVIEQAGLRFDNMISYGEDLVFMIDYMQHTDCLILCDRCDYIYRLSLSGLSGAHSRFESEYAFLTRLKGGISNLLGGTRPTPEWLNRRYAKIAIRAISCLYRPPFQKPRQERLASLSRVATENPDILQWDSRISMRLLAAGRYRLLDAMLTVIYKMRYSPLKSQWKKWQQFKNQRQYRK